MMVRFFRFYVNDLQIVAFVKTEASYIWKHCHLLQWCCYKWNHFLSIYKI